MTDIPGTHFIEKCRDHNWVVAQCRCPGRDKAVHLVPCPGFPTCPGAAASKEEK